jgi:hypothetical protein
MFPVLVIYVRPEASPAPEQQWTLEEILAREG